MNKNIKRALSLLLIAMMLLPTLAGCGGSTSEPGGTSIKEEDIVDITKVDQDTKVDETKTYKKELTVSQGNPVVNFNPQFKMDNAHDTAFKMVYNQLVEYDYATGELAPELAESWVVTDSQHYTFTLRKGIKFSNGEELTADDVIFTFTELPVLCEGTSGAAVWNEIESITANGDYEVSFVLTAPDADFLYRMYLQPYSIMNREACEKDLESGLRVGTNGWIVQDFVSSDRIVFTRFDESWVWEESGVSPTEKVTMTYMAEGSARTIALQTGEVAATTLDSTTYESVANDPNVQTLVYDSETLMYVLCNMNQHLENPSILSQDKNLRYAIAYALNYDDLNTYHMDGKASRAYSYWGKNQYGLFEDFDEKVDFDLEKAKEYMAKSTVPGGCTLKLATGPAREGLATLVQSQLKQIGIDIVIDVGDTATMTAHVKAGDFDLMFYNITLQTIGDRCHFVSNYSSSTNRAKYENEEMAAKFDQALAETDDAKRRELYKEIQIMMNDDKPYIPFYYEISMVGWHTGVSGVQWTPDNKPDYSHIMWAE